MEQSVIRPVHPELKEIHCFADFIEIGELKGTTAIHVIEFFKEQFSCHGIPDVLVTHKNSQSFPENGISDSFYQRMESMINKEDVQSILEKQRET